MPFCIHCGYEDDHDPATCPSCGRPFSKMRPGKSRKRKTSKPEPIHFKTTKVVAAAPRSRASGQGYEPGIGPRLDGSGRTQYYTAESPPPKPPAQASYRAPRQQTYSAPRRTYTPPPRPAPQPQYRPRPVSPPPRQQYYAQPPPPPFYPQRLQDQRAPQRQYQPQPAPQPAPQRRSGGGGGGGAKDTFKRIVSAIIIFVILILLLAYYPLIIGFVNGLIGDNVNPDMRMFPEESEFEIKRVVTLSTPSGSVAEYTVRAYNPVDIDMPGGGSLQTVVSFEKSPAPTDTIPKTDGFDVLLWKDSSFSGNTQIVFNYHFKARSYQWKIDADSAADISAVDSAVAAQYNHDEWAVVDGYGAPVDFDGDLLQDYRINPTNPVIKAKADELTAGKNNTYSAVKAIYDYIVNNYAYPDQTQMEHDAELNWNLPKCPLVTMKDKYGDCDDQSLLFCSLCRAAGIPAWLELGALYDSVKGSWVGHGWANVYIPMKDGSERVCTVDCVNQEFLFRDCFRFTDWIDTGGDVNFEGEVKNNLDYYYHWFSHSGDCKGDSGDLIKISFKSEGMINKPIDGPGGKYILPGLSQKPGTPGFEAAVGAGALIAATLVMAAARRVRPGGS